MTTSESPLPPSVCVLVVEDEPLIALDAETTLLALGVSEVVIARTVADALRALDTRPFQVALLDMRLGQDLSIPVAERLVTLGVPFGFLTGFPDVALPAHFRDAPALIKPFTPGQLGALVRSLLAPA